MKISVITDEISSDLETAVEIASDWGVKHVEIRKILGHRVPDGDLKVKQMKEIMSYYGVEVVAISPGVFKCGIEDLSAIKSHLENRLPRSIELACDLGAKIIIVFGFRGESSEYGRYFNRMVNILGKAADYAAERDIILALENEHSCLADTGEKTANLVKAVKRENLRVNWDPCNAFMSGENPLKGYEYVRDLVVHVHLKDAIIDKDAGKRKYVPIGEGEVNIFDQVKRLKADGYKGCLSIETHIRREKVKNTFKCFKKLKSFLESI